MSNNMASKLKIVVLTRVLLHYRLGIFEKLSDLPEVDLTVIHGCDFPGTKVTNSTTPHRFTSIRLSSLPIRLSTSNGIAVAPFSPGLIWQLIKLRPDVIICEGASNLPNDILTYLYSAIFEVRLVYWGLGEIKGRKKSRLRKALDGLIERMERKANACLAYSSRGKEYFLKVGVPEDRIFVAVNVVDTDRIKQIASQFNKEQLFKDAHHDVNFIVLFVGALLPEKKIDMLINAFQEFCQRTSALAKLIIVGDGNDRARLETLARTTSNIKIEFAGQVIDEVSRYFLVADLFVLPGLGGLAISEAMAYGLPVIASIGDGCEVDLLADGAGILDESLDAASLTDHLIYLYKNPSILANMKAIAKNTISKKYNTAAYVEGILAAARKI